jgi:hypothetical protein
LSQAVTGSCRLVNPWISAADGKTRLHLLTLIARRTGGGWAPNGYGVLTEKITIAEDGKSYRSMLAYKLFNNAGKSVEGGGEATGSGTRIGF